MSERVLLCWAFLIGVVGGCGAYKFSHYQQTMKLKMYEKVCRVNNIKD